MNEQKSKKSKTQDPNVPVEVVEQHRLPEKKLVWSECGVTQRKKHEAAL